MTLNQRVLGSSPSASTIFLISKVGNSGRRLALLPVRDVRSVRALHAAITTASETCIAI